MTFEEFSKTLGDPHPPHDANQAMKALWYDAKGDWNKAHVLAQDVEDYTGAWVHAYLHRKEGDASNAAYWYSRAGKNMPQGSLQEEWESIVRQLLDQ